MGGHVVLPFLFRAPGRRWSRPCKYLVWRSRFLEFVQWRRAHPRRQSGVGIVFMQKCGSRIVFLHKPVMKGLSEETRGIHFTDEKWDTRELLVVHPQVAHGVGIALVFKTQVFLTPLFLTSWGHLHSLWGMWPGKPQKLMTLEPVCHLHPLCLPAQTGKPGYTLGWVGHGVSSCRQRRMHWVETAQGVTPPTPHCPDLDRDAKKEVVPCPLLPPWYPFALPFPYL